VTSTPAVERAVARVDVGAIERNCACLRSLLTGGAELCAVVKANGYGHGDEESARAALAGGATWLAVATGDEASALREAGIDGRLLVMGALTGADAATAAASGAEVVAWDERFVDELAAAAARGEHLLRVHVKLDTGMGRLGTKDPELALALCERVRAHETLELAGVMTHFATADEVGDQHFGAQLRAFREFERSAKRIEPGLVAHAANSAAALRDPDSHLDMARCGIAIYGLDPFGEDPARHGLEPALELRSYVADVKRFESGDSAGYGRSWSASEPTNVGVLPIGYGDGVRRALSNNSDVLVRGRRHRLVGTVSMDNVTIDLGPNTNVRRGDPAVLIGSQDGERILCEEVARRLDTINYEVTCALTQRVRREHVGP
jgi:alanine racemase